MHLIAKLERTSLQPVLGLTTHESKGSPLVYTMQTTLLSASQ